MTFRPWSMIAVFFVATTMAAVSNSVRAANAPVAAGQTLSLDKDLVLSGSDTLEINGTVDKPCTIAGNGFALRCKGEWTGHVKITWATIKDLGKLQAVIKTPGVNGNYPSFHIEDPDAPGMVLVATGNGDITIEHCTFDQSSNVLLTANGNATVNFRGNTMLENALYPVSEMPSTSRPAVVIEGSSQAKKFFQGNRIYKGETRFRTANLLIGGDRDEDSNLIIGIRAKIEASGSGTVIKGNYVHVLLLGAEVPPHYAFWSQVSTFTPGAGTVAEYNIIRDGEWIVRFVEGEFRYNVICDIADHDLCENGSIGRIHHNVFFASKPDHFQGQMGACIDVIYKPKTADGGVEIFNNTFDGVGWVPVPAVAAGGPAFVKTLRNNAFVNFALPARFIAGDNAMVCTDWNEKTSTTRPDRIGYADYNLFFNPLNKTKVHYSIGVAGRTERKDAGFALNDVHKGGPVNEDVDPQFQAPTPRSFEFKDEDIKAGKVTVRQMLEYFRKAYAPAAGSPLLGGGDPADGPKSFIGAVSGQAGAPNDNFGRLGAAAANN